MLYKKIVVFGVACLVNGTIQAEYLQPFAPYFSQSGQDKYVNEHVFFNKRNGVFVEIGAHDGVSYSNAFYFEQKLGWDGICIEPHSEKYAELCKNRKAVCLNCCVSDFNGEASFVKVSGAPEMLSGLKDCYDPRQIERIEKELASRGGSKEVVSVRVRQLNDILAERSIKRVDLLSVDTEGSEEKIIFSIDFDAVDIDVIVCENNFGDNRIKNYLISKGYEHLKHLGGDDVFKKKSPFLDSYALAQDDLAKGVKAKLKLFSESAYSTLATVHSSYKIALDCIKNAIPGDFVECGVAGGTQVAAMAYAVQSFSAPKKVHLFDSFEGIPLAGPNDSQQPGIGAITHSTQVSNLDELLVSSGVSVCSVENVQKNMLRWGIDAKNLVYHKGWFQHTLPVKAPTIEKICFLRLDGDLYESTKVCLEYLYPKISKGGYIVIDDYTSLSGCKKAVHEYLGAHNLSPVIMEIPQGQGPVFWQVQ